MKTILNLLVLTFLFIFLVSANSLAQDGVDTDQAPKAVILTDEQGKYALGLYLEILEDPSTKLTIADVTSPGFVKQFVPSDNKVPNFGYTRSAYWARFRVKNKADQTRRWRLECAYPNMQNITLYLPRYNPPGFNAKRAGIAFPFSTRDVAYHTPVFKLQLPSEREETIYLRFETGSSMTLPITLWSLEAFAETSMSEQLKLGFYYGLLLIMIVYNLFLVISLRDKGHFFYVMFVTSCTLFQLTYDGLASQYLWPNSVLWTEYSQPLLLALTTASVLMFGATFLETRVRSPRAHRVIIISLVLCGLITIQIPFLPFGFVARQLVVLMAFVFFTMVVVGLATWREGYRAARYFSLAWLIFFVAGIMKALVRYGLLPSTGLTEYSIQIGTVLTVLFLALAVPDRFNILRQEKAEEQVKALEEIFQAKTQWERTFDAVPDLIAILDDQYRIVRANKAMVDALSGSSEEVIGKPCYEVIHGRDAPPPFCPHSKLLSDGNEHSTEIMEERFGGIFHVTTSPLHGAGGRTAGSVMVARDVTERKKAENAVRESEERYRRIIDNLQDMYYQADMSGCLTFVSPSAKTVFGLTPEELVGANMLEMVVDSDIRIQIIKELGEKGSIDSFEAELRTLNGTVWVASSSQVLKDRNGQVIGIEGLVRNITEQKRSERRIRTALAEKEVLMREIHHRVKNNFQVVSGLLTLQSQRIDEEEYLEIFKTTEARIRAMALVHEKLYESENLSEIGIDDYILSIARELISFREDCHAAIELRTDLEHLSFGPDTAIPIGLIVTEIVTNAMKHAFPKGGKGEVKIGLHRNNEHGFELSVSDNGIGMANSLDPDNSQSLGLQLVTAFVKKLQGEIEIDRSAGTEFKITFKPIEVREGN